ncbi:hypothetical protein, partial [Acidovorax sp. SUPP3334]|uniref:hypothetical protein n=1 Tax=Acidovorax sp. SUPP3334 TaxID=2920881 RepID=UPI0024E08AF4
DLRAAEFGLQQGMDRHPINLRDMRVVGSHLGGTLQVAPCRTSSLRPPTQAQLCATAQVETTNP